MRTNIILNDSLLKEAFKHTRARTKKDLVHLALEEFVHNHARLDIRDLKGKIEIREGYDHKALRRGK
jgi:Arc/MetJ family transcription regulator